MGKDSIFSSSHSEHRWVDQISKYFENEVAYNNIHDVPVSIFNVPKSISSVKPEAYAPQAIALGPYNHTQPELYQMEKYKLAAIKSFLNPNHIQNFHHLLINKLKELEPIIRACYHKYLDLDGDTLAWIMAIDGLFLLGILQNYAEKSFSTGKKLTHDAILYRDVMVLENQIPIILLREIRKSLQLISSPNDIQDDELFFMLRGFCQAHSPLKLARTSEIRSERLDTTTSLHLVDLMYHLIVNSPTHSTFIARNEALKKAGSRRNERQEEEGFIHNIEEIFEVGISLEIGKKILKPVKVIQTMPWDKISNLIGLKTHKKTQENQSSPVEEIKIPSVSRLYKIAGVQFSHTVGGIRDIKFVEEEATLYLPVITLNANSEVVLRNLVAYEVATTSDNILVLSQYVDLMCGIIDTTEDARLLREKGIIKGDLSYEEIANLFNSMNKSSGKGSNEIVEKINAYYNSRPLVKAKQFIKKRAYNSWKLLTLLSAILVLLLLTLHSFCQVYGCPHVLD